MCSMLDTRRHFGRLSVCGVKCALSVPDDVDALIKEDKEEQRDGEEEKKESSGGVGEEDDEEDEGATLAMEES